MLPTFHPLPNVEHKRIYMQPWQLQQVYLRLIERGITFIDGIASFYVHSERVKYIDITACENWPNLDNVFIPMLPGEIARTELEREFGKPDIPVSKYQLEWLDIPPPNFYDGRIVEGPLFYLDLSGAYNQVYEFLTLDCVWPRGSGELFLKGIAQRLRPNKLARNALVGISRTHKIDLVKNGNITCNPFHNPFFNPALYRTVQAIMHDLAQTAVDLGAFYVATDGYIFQDVDGFTHFKMLLDEWGMKYKTEQGPGYVTGWCSYKVGKKKTKVNRHNTGSLNNLLVERGTIQWWLKEKEFLK